MQLCISKHSYLNLHIWVLCTVSWSTAKDVKKVYILSFSMKGTAGPGEGASPISTSYGNDPISALFSAPSEMSVL